MIFSCYNVTLKSLRSVSIDRTFGFSVENSFKIYDGSWSIHKIEQNNLPRLNSYLINLPHHIRSEVNLWVSICHLPELVSVISDLISIIRVPTWMNIVKPGGE